MSSQSDSFLRPRAKPKAALDAGQMTAFNAIEALNIKITEDLPPGVTILDGMTMSLTAQTKFLCTSPPNRGVRWAEDSARIMSHVTGMANIVYAAKMVVSACLLRSSKAYLNEAGLKLEATQNEELKANPPVVPTDGPKVTQRVPVKKAKMTETMFTTNYDTEIDILHGCRAITAMWEYISNTYTLVQDGKYYSLPPIHHLITPASNTEETLCGAVLKSLATIEHYSVENAAKAKVFKEGCSNLPDWFKALPMSWVMAINLYAICMGIPEVARGSSVPFDQARSLFIHNSAGYPLASPNRGVEGYLRYRPNADVVKKAPQQLTTVRSEVIKVLAVSNIEHAAAILDKDSSCVIELPAVGTTQKPHIVSVWNTDQLKCACASTRSSTLAKTNVTGLVLATGFVCVPNVHKVSKTTTKYIVSGGKSRYMVVAGPNTQPNAVKRALADAVSEGLQSTPLRSIIATTSEEVAASWVQSLSQAISKDANLKGLYKSLKSDFTEIKGTDYEKYVGLFSLMSLETKFNTAFVENINCSNDNDENHLVKEIVTLIIYNCIVWSNEVIALANTMIKKKPSEYVSAREKMGYISAPDKTSAANSAIQNLPNEVKAVTVKKFSANKISDSIESSIRKDERYSDSPKATEVEIGGIKMQAGVVALAGYPIAGNIKLPLSTQTLVILSELAAKDCNDKSRPTVVPKLGLNNSALGSGKSGMSDLFDTVLRSATAAESSKAVSGCRIYKIPDTTKPVFKDFAVWLDLSENLDSFGVYGMSNLPAEPDAVTALAKEAKESNADLLAVGIGKSSTTDVVAGEDQRDVTTVLAANRLGRTCAPFSMDLTNSATSTSKVKFHCVAQADDRAIAKIDVPIAGRLFKVDYTIKNACTLLGVCLDKPSGSLTKLLNAMLTHKHKDVLPPNLKLDSKTEEEIASYVSLLLNHSIQAPRAVVSSSTSATESAFIMAMEELQKPSK